MRVELLVVLILIFIINCINDNTNMRHRKAEIKPCKRANCVKKKKKTFFSYPTKGHLLRQ